MTPTLPVLASATITVLEEGIMMICVAAPERAQILYPQFKQGTCAYHNDIELAEIEIPTGNSYKSYKQKVFELLK